MRIILVCDKSSAADAERLARPLEALGHAVRVTGFHTPRTWNGGGRFPGCILEKADIVHIMRPLSPDLCVVRATHRAGLPVTADFPAYREGATRGGRAALRKLARLYRQCEAVRYPDAETKAAAEPLMDGTAGHGKNPAREGENVAEMLTAAQRRWCAAFLGCTTMPRASEE